MDDGTAVRGVVLAGGDSARFDDGEKALAEIDGRPMLAHVVDAVDAGTDGRPVLAVGDEAEADRLRRALARDRLPGALDDRGDGLPSVETVVDDRNGSGPLAGLLAAADAAADGDWLFACACDMPLVTPSAIEALRSAGDRAADGRAGEPDAVVPVVDGHRQPLHALYRCSALEAVRDDLPETASLMALLDALGGVVAVSDGNVDARLDRATTNVNTRSDLADIRNDVDE